MARLFEIRIKDMNLLKVAKVWLEHEACQIFMLSNILLCCTIPQISSKLDGKVDQQGTFFLLKLYYDILKEV